MAETTGTLRFDRRRAFELALAVREIGWNAVRHARGARAEVTTLIGLEDARGVVVVITDDGPGIADTSAALRDGYSTKGSLGLGLGAARRLADEFDLESALGAPTRVKLVKWARAADPIATAADMR